MCWCRLPPNCSATTLKCRSELPSYRYQERDTTVFTLTGLIPGRKYYFIVGQNHGGGVAWSAWVELSLNSDSQSCPTAAAPTPQPTPTPTQGPTPTPRPTPTGTGDYDTDKDGLIEISNLAQLDAIRWDLGGDGVSSIPSFAAAFPNAMPGMGCPDSNCVGYELVANLDFDSNANGQADAGDVYWNDGKGWVPIGSEDRKFNAIFDGGGHSITNLYINSGDNYVGLFGYTSQGSAIQRASLESVRVTSAGYAIGSLVGANGGTITASHAAGSVLGDGDSVGGLVGSNLHSRSITITASYATGNVSGASNVGGLVGDNRGAISDSYAAGSVSGVSGVGGLIGGNQNFGAITASYATGNVSGISNVGGLVGVNLNNGSITASYATGSVAGSGSNIGGLVGLSRSGRAITASYATGSVSGDGDDIGGLVGDNRGAVSQSYAMGEVSGSDETTYLGGLVGYNEDIITHSYWDTQTSGLAYSDGGQGKTTQELQSPTGNTGIYANWSADWWDFGTSSQYPLLKYGGLEPAQQRR